MIEIITLSIIQGVTEFIPVSSSAHLILVSKYFNFANSNITLDVSLHLGSLLAIILYFKKDLKKNFKQKKIFQKIIISCIPVTFVGFFLIKFDYLEQLRNFKVIGWSTIIFGIILFFSDLNKQKYKIEKKLNIKNMLLIGFFQTLSLIPGVSRSGIIITGSRFLKFNRTDSAKISYITSLPVLTIASLYNLQQIIIQKNLNFTLINLFSVITSFIFSYITIKLFLGFLKRFSLLSFVLYRIVLGLIILIYAYN